MRRRLLTAAFAGIAVFFVSRFAITWFLARYACPRPGDWLPDWAIFCGGDPATTAARNLMTAGWDGALPAMLGAATFLAIGLTRGT